MVNFPNGINQKQNQIDVVKAVQGARVTELSLVKEPKHVIVEKKGNEIDFECQIFRDLNPEEKQEINSSQGPNGPRGPGHGVRLPFQGRQDALSSRMQSDSRRKQNKADFKKLAEAFDF